MSFPARYPGRCRGCEERIHEGEMIKMTEVGAVHDDCDEAAPLPERVVPTCERCWLTKPCGCDDPT